MSDLISRQAALDALCAVCGKACDKSKFVYNAPQDEQVILCPEHYGLSTLPSVTPTTKKCYNLNKDYAECDQFVCSNCGIELLDWRRVEHDEDGDITYHEYELRFCPNCGAKIL